MKCVEIIRDYFVKQCFTFCLQTKSHRVNFVFINMVDSSCVCRNLTSRVDLNGKSKDTGLCSNFETQKSKKTNKLINQYFPYLLSPVKGK